MESAGFEDARNAHAQVERRIQELEGMIQNAIIIPDHTRSRAKSDIIEVGSIVKVQPLGSKRAGTYTIVGSTEAAPGDGVGGLGPLLRRPASPIPDPPSSADDGFG